MKKAIIFGASGFVGSCLLNELLENPVYAQVTCIVRRPLLLTHKKLQVVICDFNAFSTVKLEGDEVFIALGTTRKQTPDPREYYQIDHDYVVAAAKLCKESGVKSIFLVSAVGADSTSRFVYVRTKGEVERDIRALGFEHTHLFQPSMITGQRVQYRRLESSLIGVWNLLNPLLRGSLKRYRGIEGDQIAKAMVNAAQIRTGHVQIYAWQQMQELLNHESV